jgi:FtsH-binding integral membrane protein
MASFADQTVRRGFMRKVFSIVALQLAVTAGFALMCIFVRPIRVRALVALSLRCKESR